MRLKTLRRWHKYRYLWLALIAWTVISAIMLGLFGFSLIDSRGPLAKVTADFAIEMDGEDIEALLIEGDGIKLELVATYDTKKIKASLYGLGYAGQRINLYEKEGVGYIKLDQWPPLVNDQTQPPQLTMRVIVPAKDYHQITVNSTWLVGEIIQLKGDKLLGSVDHGFVLIDNSRLKQVDLTTKSADITIKRSKIVALAINNPLGNTVFDHNRVNFGQYQGHKGNVSLFDKRSKGVWQLNNVYGDIIISTSTEPYNLMVDLLAARGTVQVSYDSDQWGGLLSLKLKKNGLQGTVGQGHSVIQAYTDHGDIIMGKGQQKEK